MKFFSLFLSLFLLISCSKQITTTAPIDSKEEEKEDKVVKVDPESPLKYEGIEEIPKGELQNILWIHRGLTSTFAKKFNDPVLLFVYDTKNECSNKMDYETFSDPDVGRFINKNFISSRADYREFKGNLPSCSIMVLTSTGHILFTVVGFIPQDQIRSVLTKAIYIHDEVMKVNDGEDKPEIQTSI